MGHEQSLAPVFKWVHTNTWLGLDNHAILSILHLVMM